MVTMSRSLGILLGAALDQVLADPSRHHPVAWFGTSANWLETRTYRDDLWAGARHTLVALAPVAALGVILERATTHRPALHTAATAAAVWVCLGGTSLAREGSAMADELDAHDMTAARDRLTHLCSRDPTGLDAAELARGTTESLAENTSDAVVCSLFWVSVAGIPGVLVHRGINTLDAMIGYRNERYERFGKVAARLDDVVAWLPARIAGLLSCVAAPTVEGNAFQAFLTMMRDAHRHPSPNGGWTEAAWAGALGTHLGGSSTYHGHIEHRPLLGDPATPPPDPTTIRRASRLVRVMSVGSAVLAAYGALRRSAKGLRGSR